MVYKYAEDEKVAFHGFSRQYEEEEVIIQSSITNIPLILPIEAMEIIDELVRGKTIVETSVSYYQKHGETPDIVDLLEELEKNGFINSLNEVSNQSSKLKYDKSKIANTYHFEYFPQDLARKIFSVKALYLYAAIIIIALFLIVLDPLIIPGWRSSFFTKNLTLMKLLLATFDFVTLFGHEMAHLIAAKAMGVSSSLGFGHRLWYLVAETDMTRIWSIPRQYRFLPVLAGSLIDAVFASILVFTISIEHRAWISLPQSVSQFLSAMLFVYLTRLLWQCYFFVRTDFYYVFANYFRCNNLMQDTEVFLINKLHTFLPSIRQTSQNHIPLRERRVIRIFALFWIFGRVAAILSLVFLELPLLLSYFSEIYKITGRGYQSDPYAFIDAFLMLLLIVVPQVIGLWLWLRSFRSFLTR